MIGLNTKLPKGESVSLAQDEQGNFVNMVTVDITCRSRDCPANVILFEIYEKRQASQITNPQAADYSVCGNGLVCLPKAIRYFSVMDNIGNTSFRPS